MNLRSVFGVFSRRYEPTVAEQTSLPITFRNRLMMLCVEQFGSGNRRALLATRFWDEMIKSFAMLLGQPFPSRPDEVPALSVINYVLNCPDIHVFDFIELIFQLPSYRSSDRTGYMYDENTLVGQISQLFLVDGLPYAVSPFVREPQNSSRIVSYPRVISRDNEFAYSELIKPTIALLSEAGYSSANGEFLEALEDYRKGDYGDCLTKCGSAFESTMKIACHRNGWPYDQNDTASTLVHTVVTQSGLESYLEAPLIVIATLRNRLSKSHGAGTQLRSVPVSRVRYTINATASAILLLVDHIREISK